MTKKRELSEKKPTLNAQEEFKVEEIPIVDLDAQDNDSLKESKDLDDQPNLDQIDSLEPSEKPVDKEDQENSYES